ncbi:hypothetical protein [Bordetella bronchiseptica]|uniref:hypothetical protein n=1 Tax=Bordetella bronchiseptica TaxID=518 RepID=UPI0009B70CD2|nr:hypothetical protein [Bordetella bronchiseptica]AUL17971.1 hypothetical protein BTL45_15885 [Bordetella bronchiseptica]AWP59512.1 hypothetical protein B7P02_16505 [Bordetella bronchiseptica]AWQ06164.1 hypothetical protein B9G73_16020 [Bordetella bronchiseptica]QET71327.1 hypothetical protein FOB42_13835 [Bordetella bronchiseptica]QIX99327.1 hypothetical protein FOC01_04255 [Bordetella bronchiseptica]
MTHGQGVRAQECWDNEGGSQIFSLAASFELEEFEESERRILAFLGASVLSLWDDLPATDRQRVLNREAAQAAFDKSAIKAKIASFVAGDVTQGKDHVS